MVKSERLGEITATKKIGNQISQIISGYNSGIQKSELDLAVLQWYT